MDLTLRWFEQTFARLREKGTLRFQNQQFRIRDKQLKEEREIMNNTMAVCRVDKTSRNLSQLDYESLRELSSDQFFNVDLMKYIACVTSSIYYMPSEAETTTYTSTDKIHEYIQNLKILASGSYGDTMTGNLSTDKNNIAKELFVVKAPKDLDHDNLQHEYFVGMQALNRLRKHVPNFAYIYGGFSCSKPVIGDEKVYSWCTSDKKSVRSSELGVKSFVVPLVEYSIYVPPDLTRTLSILL